MKLLPADDFVLETPLGAEAALAALAQEVQPREPFFRLRPHRSFFGVVTASGFRIQRIITGRNSFAPVITGTVGRAHVGAVVQVRMRLHGFTTAFLWLWTASNAVFTAFLVLAAVSGQDVQAIFFLGPLGMLIFAYLLTILGFSMGADSDRAELVRILQAVQK